MLVIKRRAGETFMIGDDIRVTVVRIKGSTVGIGIEAPSHLPVDREEVRIRQAQELAEEADGLDLPRTEPDPTEPDNDTPHVQRLAPKENSPVVRYKRHRRA